VTDFSPRLGDSLQAHATHAAASRLRALLYSGASVARIARAHGVNANQVFYWRMLHRKGRLGAATLLPVRVTSETLSVQAPPLPERACAKSPSISAGTIHIELQHAQVRSREAAIQLCCGCCWSVCSGDRTARQHAYLDCCRRNRPAPRLQGF
jgi:transposase